MIDWITGASYARESKHVSTDEGMTILDEPPETPAPVFAIRAFKTALFGTPPPPPEEKTPGKIPKDTEPSQTGNGGSGKLVEPPDSNIQNGQAIKEVVAISKTDQFMSPTKGILLTPGTGASKRKTVSFQPSKEFEQAGRVENPPKNDKRHLPSGKSQSTQQNGTQQAPQPSALTKALFELSTRRVELPPESPFPETPVKGVETQQRPSAPAYKPLELSADFKPTSEHTLDLSQPRSQSGQHWKKEFEEYHEKSNREMKKVIQYGQNIKSYALMKDLEATKLNEKLKTELAKVARMEAKVSKLAKQLSMSQSKTPLDENDQTRLVGELAQQTALTVRYQRKAEQYRKAIKRRAQNNGPETIEMSLFEDESRVFQYPDQSEVLSLQAQFESLKETAKQAEDRASRLEAENSHLKRNLARVKEEMMGYESRRRVREDRLRKREEKHKSAKEECEIRLAELKVENQKLLAALQVSRINNGQAGLSTGLAQSSESKSTSEPIQLDKYQTAPFDSKDDEKIRQSSLSPRKGRRPKASDVDIWTHNSPTTNEVVNVPLQATEEPTPLGPSSVKHDIHRALQEINQNLTSGHQDPHLIEGDGALPLDSSKEPKARLRMPYMSATMPSGYNSRNGNISRTSTMGSARTSSLSAERTAAAKARLAERKRSAEKKDMTPDDRRHKDTGKL